MKIHEVKIPGKHVDGVRKKFNFAVLKAPKPDLNPACLLIFYQSAYADVDPAVQKSHFERLRNPPNPEGRQRQFSLLLCTFLVRKSSHENSNSPSLVSSEKYRFSRILLSENDHFPVLPLAHYPVFNSCPRFLGYTRTELASRRVEHRSFPRVAVALPRVRHTHRLRRRMSINDAHGNIEAVVCHRGNQSSRDKQLARRLPHN